MESLALGLSHASRKSTEYLSRTVSSTGHLPENSPATASNVASSLLEAFKAILLEVDSYTTLFEARLKLEEDYVKNLRSMIETQTQLDAKVNAKIAATTGMLSDSLQSLHLRTTWRELRENDLRELDARVQHIESMKEAVLMPLLSFHDSQERIRKRVKEDFRTSLSHYDEMRNVTLPKVKRAYERKAEEVEQLKLQQQAIQDQRALLSQRSTEKEFGHASSPEPEHEGGIPIANAASSMRRAASSKLRSRATSGNSAKSLGFGSKQALSADERSPFNSPPTNELPLSTSVPSQSSSIPSPTSDRPKPHFFDAFKSREGWEAAKKEAPKKLGALINKMREVRDASAGGATSVFGAADSNNSSSAVGSSSGEPRFGGLAGGLASSGSIRATQTMALKQIKAKRETDEADKAYRKVIFDLETSRLRRAKTIKAAVTSVIECRKELAHTSQAVWLQAERCTMTLHRQRLGLNEEGESTVERALDNLDKELKDLEQNLPSLKDLDDQRISYFNYWNGELKNLIFGTPLVDYPLTVPYRLSDTVVPPLIVTKCIEFIETRALEHPGIYRISAKHSTVKQLALAIEKDEYGFQFDPERDEPSAVAGVLKDYLRQLPEPVMAIPWPERVKYTHERDDHIRTGFAVLKGRIRRLPPIHQITLKVIVQHLSKVAQHSDQNKMTAANLSVVFSPCLLSETDHETTSVAAAMEEDKTMEDLILYCSDIFDLSTAGASILPPIAYGRSDELSRAGQSAAKLVFAASSATSLNSEQSAAMTAPNDLPKASEATGLKQSNALTPTITAELDESKHVESASVETTESTVPLLNSLSLTTPTYTLDEPLASSSAASFASLPRIDTSVSSSDSTRKAALKASVPRSEVVDSSTGSVEAPCRAADSGTNATLARSSDMGLTPSLGGEEGQIYLAAATCNFASSPGTLASAGLQKSSGQTTPFDSTIDSARASHGHASPANEDLNVSREMPPSQPAVTHVPLDMANTDALI